MPESRSIHRLWAEGRKVKRGMLEWSGHEHTGYNFLAVKAPANRDKAPAKPRLIPGQVAEVADVDGKKKFPPGRCVCWALERAEGMLSRLPTCAFDGRGKPSKSRKLDLFDRAHIRDIMLEQILDPVPERRG